MSYFKIFYKLLKIKFIYLFIFFACLQKVIVLIEIDIIFSQFLNDLINFLFQKDNYPLINC